MSELEGDNTNKRKFEIHPFGLFQLDIAEVRTSEGKLHLFVAIDRTSKLAVAYRAQTAD